MDAKVSGKLNSPYCRDLFPDGFHTERKIQSRPEKSGKKEPIERVKINPSRFLFQYHQPIPARKIYKPDSQAIFSIPGLVRSPGSPLEAVRSLLDAPDEPKNRGGCFIHPQPGSVSWKSSGSRQKQKENQPEPSQTRSTWLHLTDLDKTTHNESNRQPATTNPNQMARRNHAGQHNTSLPTVINPTPLLNHLKIGCISCNTRLSREFFKNRHLPKVKKSLSISNFQRHFQIS